MNFAAFLEATARANAERTALAWDGGALTYGELDARASGLARSLRARGLKAGDRLALLVPNRWQFAVALLGGLKAGLTVAPIDPLLKPEERAEILGDLKPALVLDDVAAERSEWATREAPSAPALVLYTSGSTGRPKGAVLSHDALDFAQRSWAGPVMALTPDDVVLAVLPLSHSFGINGALLTPLLVGATVRIVERFTPETIATMLAREVVSVFPGVATMFRRVLDVPGFAGGARLRLAVSGAAPCPWDLAQDWRARTGVRIVRGYGMTELFRPLSYLAADPTEFPDAVGRAVPGVEARIVDEELWIRTPAAMDGYLGAPEETRAVLADGWFRTGDLATIDADGWVRITGRKRERIVRGGHSVFPQEVEAVLLVHPDVAEAAVVGVPHAELGEEVAAFVVLRPGVRATAEALIAHCRERLAGYKYPRRVTLMGALPRSSTGKVLKAKLAAEA
ncbi:MAG TPA: AMP-binding protein [Methylomirabilota bacterium]|nr:AMP-binding protein [Methylomirabilota bacterium]